jgi:hypothetical protein
MRTLVALLSAFLLASCASAPEVKSQKYAALRGDRVFEAEFPAVWKGVEKAVSGYKVTERDPEEVDALEMKKLTERSLETDWIYGQSRDKYQEYEVNGSPRKKYLQVRHRYRIVARSVMGGTRVEVAASEEIERLRADGTPDGYAGTEPDSSRANELLEKINLAILSAAP